MTFILRIFFAGLVAFVPSRDGKELTVLLVDAGPGDTMSDRSPVPLHHPLLLARARSCSGSCTADNPAKVAGLLYPCDGSNASRYLAEALAGGTVRKLQNSDLAIASGEARTIQPALALTPDNRGPGACGLPTGADGRQPFNRVADLGQLVPAAGVVNPGLLACQPPPGLIFARLRLRSGKVWTHRLARISSPIVSQVPVFDFKTLGGGGKTLHYSQPIADWVGAEIEMEGDAVEIVERSFASSEVHTLRLTPLNGLVELALLNIPNPPATLCVDKKPMDMDVTAAHFELYYKLAKTPPPLDQRPVPYAVGEPCPAAPASGPASPLLDDLKVNLSRGFYDRILCTVAQLSDGGAP